MKASDSKIKFHSISLPNELMLSEVSEFLNEGREVVIKTKGWSMLPFIIGDRDSVKLKRSESYEEGDIVLARLAGGQWVLHRLFRKLDGDRIILKGDGNLVGTEQCLLSDIRGAVVEILKPGDRAVDCTSTKFKKMSLRWRTSSYFFRRVVLAFYHRIIMRLI